MTRAVKPEAEPQPAEGQDRDALNTNPFEQELKVGRWSQVNDATFRP